MVVEKKKPPLTPTEAPPPEEERPVAVEVRDERLWVTLKDGRIIGTPMDWYPLLQDGTPEQLANVDLLWDGICWPDLEECLSVEAMLKGRRPIPWTRDELRKTRERLEQKYPLDTSGLPKGK